MELTCSRPALEMALGMVTGVVSTRTPREVLKCVRLTAKTDHIVLAGTDLEVGVRSKISQVEVKREGDILLPAEKLTQIVHELKDESLSMTVEGSAANIRGQDSFFHVYGQEPTDFPPVADFEGQPDLVVETAVLRRLIEMSSFAAARESTRYAINGVLWERKGSKLFLVATDGRRLAKAVGPVRKGTGEGINLIVPTKTMALLLRVMQAADDEEVLIRGSGNQLLVQVGGTTVSSVLVEGHFPKYEDVIPRENPTKVVFNRESLYAAIRKAALLTGDESKGIRIDLSKKGVVFSSRAPQQGEATTQLDVPYSGPEFSIGFNPGFLTDALRVIEADEVTLELSNPDKPGVLLVGKEFTYVIMPVSLA